ncbi:MFS transporter [uncultured Peptoniphilus sp.]|uniref:MFS transporter n=1 Tax=uncultured Peptoniphilus sp. TaxID=254354 RepID=UPI0028047097|nr:MFS transporter [uncultured Peptoniphilus sp.]
MKEEKNKFLNSPVKVVIIFGIISLLGDVIYEGARSANSQYFSLLGISAANIGFYFGLGEFLGYFLRLFAGLVSDIYHMHWPFIFIGYGFLIVVPLMGTTSSLGVLASLMLLERIGKALRNPSKDTLLSTVSEHEVGIGFAFGIQEALDQLGAFLGPIIFTLVFYFSGHGLASYQFAYKLLFIPFILLMAFLYFAYKKIKDENLIERIDGKKFSRDKMGKVFWIYCAFSFFSSIGFINFSIIAYHLKVKGLMTDGNITLLYSLAMIVDAITALIIGKAYDILKIKRKNKMGGILIMALIPFVTAIIPFFTLSFNKSLIIFGLLIFGLVIGSHETIIRSAIADITPFSKRGTAYGIFNGIYGLAFLIGSSLVGALYDFGNMNLIFIFVLAAQIISLYLFYMLRKNIIK